jgi:predicted transposase YbfD/YdcC
VLAHFDCDEKSNEIPAVQTLLGSLALSDAVVTVDAMHCQKKHSSMPLPVASI